MVTSYTRYRLFKINGVFVNNNPEAEAQRSYAHALSLYCNKTLPARNSVRLLSQDYCEQKILNLEKTTSSFLSVLLINLWTSLFASGA